MRYLSARHTHSHTYSTAHLLAFRIFVLKCFAGNYYAIWSLFGPRINLMSFVLIFVSFCFVYSFCRYLCTCDASSTDTWNIRTMHWTRTSRIGFLFIRSYARNHFTILEKWREYGEFINQSGKFAAKHVPMTLQARELFRCFFGVFLSSIEIGSRIGNQHDQNAFAQKLFGIGTHRGDGVSDQCRFAELGRIAGRHIERTEFRCICGELFPLSLSV